MSYNLHFILILMYFRTWYQHWRIKIVECYHFIWSYHLASNHIWKNILLSNGQKHPLFSWNVLSPLFFSFSSRTFLLSSKSFFLLVFGVLISSIPKLWEFSVQTSSKEENPFNLHSGSILGISLILNPQYKGLLKEDIDDFEFWYFWAFECEYHKILWFPKPNSFIKPRQCILSFQGFSISF